jgi:hypothetical protein
MNEDLRKWFYVYALVNPINNVIFYIGKGSKSRAYDHLKPSGWGNNLHKKHTIENIRSCGKEPLVMFLHENLEEHVAFQLEIEEIKKHKELGFKLTNMTDGGDGGPKRFGSRSIEERRYVSQKTKEAMWKSDTRQRHLQSIQSDLNRKNLKEAQKLKINANPDWHKKFTKSNYNEEYRTRKIIRDDGMIFNSAEDVAKHYNTNLSVIVRHLLGKRKTYKKYVFKFVD